MARATLPLLLVALSSLGLGACDKQPNPTTDPTAATSKPELSAAWLREFTRRFSADELGGRLPGSEGGRLAVAQIIETMTAIGLEPAGEDGGWTQRVRMRGVTLDRERSTLELVDADGQASALAFGQDWVGTSFAAGDAHALDAELVFVGYGVSAPEHHWDDYAGVDVRGKVVLAFVGDPPTGDDRFGGPAMTYYGRWSYKYERALAAGAVGCLVIHEAEPASYGWNVPTTSYSSERFHVLGPDGQPPPAMALRGWMSMEASDALAKRGGSSLADWHEQAMAAEFGGRELGLKLRGELLTHERVVEDVNVLGRLPGAAVPDEAVFVTAHWDHMGTDADLVAAGEDGIYNGAIDNASGIASMLGVAAALAKGSALDRSVVFLATTAEEQGLLGSRAWVASPTMAIEDVVALVNLDSMNVYGETGAVEVVGSGQTTLEARLAALAEAQGRVVRPDSHPESGGFYRSDHFPFAKAGVPALYFHGSLETLLGEGDSEAIRAGVRERYHTPADEFDDSWSFAGALQDAMLVVALIRAVAAADVRPQYEAGSEFAGLR